MSGQRVLRIGATLMMFLGFVRALGGVMLLTSGASIDSRIQASAATVTMVGAGLLALGLILVVSAFGVLRQSRFFWTVGIACTVAFVVDGAINGALLYGRPGDQGTVVNVFMAALILICLFRGASALPPRGAVASAPTAG